MKKLVFCLTVVFSALALVAFSAFADEAAVSAMASLPWYATALEYYMIITSVLGTAAIVATMTPTPKDDEADPTRSSRVFNNKTTTEVGTPIQLIFGRHLVAFHLFSFNIDARSYDGLDRPDQSPYFKGKADEAMPELNNNKFYGYVKAGDTVLLNQTNNETYRTGREF